MVTSYWSKFHFMIFHLANFLNTLDKDITVFLANSPISNSVRLYVNWGKCLIKTDIIDLTGKSDIETQHKLIRTVANVIDNKNLHSFEESL